MIALIFDTCKLNGWSVDYLINNAGFGGQGDFARERTMEDDLSMIAVNIATPTRLCKLFLPEFIKRGSGKVLNVSSTAAVMPGPLQAVYYATKSYLTSFSNALWRELKGTGVTVTALMPGAMETGFAKTGGLTETKLFANAVSPMMPKKAMMDFVKRHKVLLHMHKKHNSLFPVGGHMNPDELPHEAAIREAYEE